MDRRLKIIAVILILLYGLNHWVLGLSWLASYRSQVAPLAAFTLYPLGLVLAAVNDQSKLNWWRTGLVWLSCLAIPVLVILAMPAEDRLPNGSYQTWFVGGVSTLLAIMMARGRPWFAWSGLLWLWLVVIIWGGPATITTTGLIGALLVVAAAFAIGVALDNNRNVTADYLAQATATATRTAQLLARRNQRKAIVQQALLEASPLLEAVAKNGGKLTENGKAEAKLVEARLRDEISGRSLLDNGVRVEVREARKRGVEVTINDEAGLDAIDPDELDSIRDSIAKAIRATQSGKIAIRAPKGESYLVSIIATRPEASSPDLWLRLP